MRRIVREAAGRVARPAAASLASRAAASCGAAPERRQSIGHFKLQPFGSPMSPFLRKSDLLPV